MPNPSTSHSIATEAGASGNGSDPGPGGHSSANPASAGSKLWFLASLPPPVNGQANCNAAMRTLLSKTVRLRPLSLGRSPLDKIARSFANGWTLLRNAKRGDAIYISIPGQWGSWLLLPTIAVARWCGLAVWFHHHSFRAINLGPMPAMCTLVALAGLRQNHILLSDGMRDRFAGMYLRPSAHSDVRSCRPNETSSHPHGGDVRAKAARAHAMSNTVLLAPDLRAALPPRPDRPPTLGHVSVLTREKGVVYLIDLFEELRRHVPDIRLVIAGPSNDAALLEAVHEAEARHAGAFEYRGEIAGVEKDRFYADIDLFVLPTTLIDEAEPLVMIEAYSRGVEVFATAVGCIPDRIRNPDLILSLDRSDDATRIAARIATLARSVTGWAHQRVDCQAHVARLSAHGDAQGAALLEHLYASVGYSAGPGIGLGRTEPDTTARATATKADAP